MIAVVIAGVGLALMVGCLVAGTFLIMSLSTALFVWFCVGFILLVVALMVAGDA